jgi:catechol 2,3-dioxygenase-like lactoylglutathione lyase family enzyme
MKKTLLLILGLMCADFVQAQTQFNFTFNHLALSVKDVNRSVEFYQKVFQLKEISNRTKMEGIRWMSFTEGKELHLISILKESVTINKAVHLAMTTQNLDDFMKWLDENKIAFSDWPGAPHTINQRADGVKQIYLQDPDGYWIEVNNGYGK